MMRLTSSNLPSPARSSAPFGNRLVQAVGVLLVTCYTIFYLGHPKLPGNDPSYPLGWWGWFDQSMTLRSTTALVRGNLDPSQHHYPFGYSLLGMPFNWVMPVHTFFFVDLLSLLGAFVGFVALARRMKLPEGAAAVLFALAMLGDKVLFLQWIIPWNTVPVGAFIWLLLAAIAAWLDGQRRPWQTGMLMGAIVACRPSDATILLPCLVTLLWAEWGMWRRQLNAGLRLLAGGALVVLPVVALHLASYGLAQSLYMTNSAQIGFTLFDFGWKAYVLFVDPFPWFADGKGLLQHAHWMALGLAGIVPALLRDAKSRLVAAVIVVHAIVYVSYVDLLPTGLWRFSNVHYFTWAIPGYALLAGLLIRDVVAGEWARPWIRWVGIASTVATLLVLCLRVIPGPVADDRPAKAIDFAGPVPPFADTFLSGRLVLRDQDGVLQDVRDIRGFVVPDGLRVIGLRRNIRGAVEWLPGHAPQGYDGVAQSARWALEVQLAWPPRWMRRAAPPGIPVPVE